MSRTLEIPMDREIALVVTPALTKLEFEELCAANSDLNLERTKEGGIVLNAPASSGAADANAEITAQLRFWWKTHRSGRVYDSSVGVNLPDGAQKGPDAAYATATQVETLVGDALNHFLPFVPAFVIELRSPSDRPKKDSAKMEQWVANGAELAWLVNPVHRQVKIYEKGHPVRIESGLLVTGSGPVEGFILDLTDVWAAFSPKK
jgi:Uma2 family endonuclease